MTSFRAGFGDGPGAGVAPGPHDRLRLLQAVASLVWTPSAEDGGLAELSSVRG